MHCTVGSLCSLVVSLVLNICFVVRLVLNIKLCC